MKTLIKKAAPQDLVILLGLAIIVTTAIKALTQTL